jgi:hypothetical protein
VITADGLDNADRAKDAIDEIGIQAEVVHRYEDRTQGLAIQRGSDEMHVGALEIDSTVGADPCVDEAGSCQRRFDTVELRAVHRGIDVDGAPECCTRLAAAISAPRWRHRFDQRPGSEALAFGLEVGLRCIEALLFVAQPADVSFVLATDVVAKPGKGRGDVAR